MVEIPYNFEHFGIVEKRNRKRIKVNRAPPRLLGTKLSSKSRIFSKWSENWAENGMTERHFPRRNVNLIVIPSRKITAGLKPGLTGPISILTTIKAISIPPAQILENFLKKICHIPYCTSWHKYETLTVNIFGPTDSKWDIIYLLLI